MYVYPIYRAKWAIIIVEMTSKYTEIVDINFLVWHDVGSKTNRIKTVSKLIYVLCLFCSSVERYLLENNYKFQYK